MNTTNKLVDKFRQYFYCKTIIWTTYVRIFCDGGNPIIHYFPKFRTDHHDKHWNMFGFAIYFLGREFNFSFGKDINGLYKDIK